LGSAVGEETFAGVMGLVCFRTQRAKKKILLQVFLDHQPISEAPKDLRLTATAFLDAWGFQSSQSYTWAVILSKCFAMISNQNVL
jgi:hypothetical protein